MLISLAQAERIHDQRPYTAQADVKHYSQEYRSNYGGGGTTLGIVRNHDRSHECEKSKSNESAKKPAYDACNKFPLHHREGGPAIWGVSIDLSPLGYFCLIHSV